MATRSKRTTTKTGPYSKRTVTVSSAGTRITNSTRPPGGATRRSSSINLKTGQTRVTHTTHQGGGWRSTTSKTTSVKKSRSGSGRSYSRRGSSKADGFIVELFFAAIVLVFAGIWWIVKTITKGVWEASKYAIKQEEKNFWYWTKVVFMFIAFSYITALFFYASFKLIGWMFFSESVVEVLQPV